MSDWDRAKGKSKVFYIDLNNDDNKTQALSYLYWGSYSVEGDNKTYTPESYTSIDGHKNEDTTLRTNPTLAVYPVYRVDTPYYNLYSDSATQDKIYFEFDIVYSNASSPDEAKDSDLPVDGSIFNVRGVQTTEREETMIKESDNLGWLRILLDVIIFVLSKNIKS